jgi:hypothetical protein
MKRISSILFVFLSCAFVSAVLAGCKFSKSVKKDLISGLTTTGSDLSCEDVYLKVDDQKTSRSTFTYGETFYICFDDVRGFTSENGYVFPGMEIVITDNSGDTLLQADDLYKEYSQGMNFSPLQLTADLTVADPIKSNGNYAMLINIWDKKGTGTFTSKFDFNVAGNKNISAIPESVSYSEKYLFSQGTNRVITDNIIHFNDNIYIIIEGLTGFREENGLVYPGMKMKGIDAKNNIILDYDDLLSDYSETGIAVSDFSSRVSAHFKITGSSFNNPLRCELVIWDKKSSASLKIETDMTVK